MARREWRVTVGVTLLALALLGWIGTLFITPLLQHPDSAEDLTAAWKRAGATPLGQSTMATVPPGQTLVAFLVGTDLYGIAGTTGGACTAVGDDGARVDLDWPVLIDRSLTGVLADGQESVAIAGWSNPTDHDVRVEIRCNSADSTVDHFVAMPTRTGRIAHAPWFQPWLWITLAVLGVAFVATGARRITPPSR